MKLYTISSIFILLFILPLFSIGQSIAFNKYNFPQHKKELSDALYNVKTGDKFYEQGQGMYSFAIDHYMKANRFNPKNALLNYKIGRCHLIDNDKAEAQKYLEKAYELDPRISLDMDYNDVNFLLAEAYRLDYQFANAIKKYKDHKNALNPEQLILEVKVINKKIEECQNAIEMVANAERVFVDNMGDVVNSAYSDYKPLVVPEENMLLFTSAKETTRGGKRDDDSYFFEDIYISYYENGMWTNPDNKYDLNSNNHDATAGISSDGTSLYIYKSAGGNNLFESRIAGDMYGYPEKLPNEINDGLKQASAALSFDKTTLYFTSIRKDGYGGQDIYYSKKDTKGRWSEAINIGASINTPYDEEGVYITIDSKTLYFSSQGHNSMGGFDIYRSEFVDGKWSNPVNLGYPINTPDEDVFFTMAKNKQRGYYSSKKKDGYGGHDLYMITFLGAAKPMIRNTDDNLLAYIGDPIAALRLEPKIEQNTILQGSILDAISLEPLQAIIEIVDNSKNELIASFESNSTAGSYLISLRPGINYGISVNKKDYLFHSENFEISEKAVAKKIQKDILLKKLEVGTKIVLNNIFFDFNEASLRPESEAELDRLYKLLEEVPSLKIEISGHTDNIGAASYNQKLSENRAAAVVDYLNDNGISLERLTFAGYGFTQPVASNDNEDGRQMNRRTEFKVLEK